MGRPGPQHPQVWFCPCGRSNFWWRTTCFKCSKEPPVDWPAGSPDRVAAGAATGQPTSPSGDRQQAEGATVDLPPAPPAAGIDALRDELYLRLITPPDYTRDGLARWRHDLAARREEIGRLERLLAE